MDIDVNGRRATVDDAWRGESLLWVLREALGLVGTKFGCGTGLCGACTVLVDGRPARSCTIGAADVAGARIETIEGFARHDALHPVQQAWLDASVPQCGYCQAGQIVAAVALLRATPRPTADEIDAAMAGHLCRCGTQQRVRDAVRLAARRIAGERA